MHIYIYIYDKQQIIDALTVAPILAHDNEDGVEVPLDIGPDTWACLFCMRIRLEYGYLYCRDILIIQIFLL